MLKKKNLESQSLSSLVLLPPHRRPTELDLSVQIQILYSVISQET